MHSLWRYLCIGFLVLLAGCGLGETHIPERPSISSITPTRTMVLSTFTPSPTSTSLSTATIPQPPTISPTSTILPTAIPAITSGFVNQQITCASNTEIASALSGPYLGQEPPGMEPKIFAPGVVSDPDFSEYSGSFSPDGSEYYFYRFSPSSETVLLFTKIVDGNWSVPEQLMITADYVAFEPYITMDNQRLYFAWGHPVPPGKPQFPYYFVERIENGWSEPRYAGQGMFLSSSQDGQLYITDMSSREVDGKTYLARISVTDGVFTDYERLDIEVPLGNPAHPCIALDESYILFDVESGNHLFLSFKKADGSWGEPIDLTKHGFDRRAGGAYISPDGKYLFFAFNKDIWWVDIKVIENLRPSE
jgi:hypothetical protein